MTPRVEQIGDCTLALGDCLEILPTMGKIDAIVSDPPYGMNYNTDSKRFSRNAASWNAPTRRWSFPGRMPGSFPSGTPRRRISASKKNTARLCPYVKLNCGKRKRRSPHPERRWNTPSGNANKA